MSELIRHDGVVLRVDERMVRVKISQTSACVSCQARQMCMSSDVREKEVDCVPYGEGMRVGDRVEVLVTEAMGWKAVLLAYILPFVLLVGLVTILDFWLANEVMAGTLSLCGVALYFVVLAFHKEKIKRQFRFIAIKKNN